MGLVDEASLLKRQFAFCEHAPLLGFVYVIGNDSNQLVKIGTSGFSEIEKRVRALETMSPVGVRRHGEWFDLSTGEVDEYFAGSARWSEPTWLTCHRRCSSPVFTCEQRILSRGSWEWRGKARE